MTEFPFTEEYLPTEVSQKEDDFCSYLWDVAQSVGKIFGGYVDPTVLFLGLTGNVVTACVFFKNNKQHTALFLGALSLSDIGHNICTLIYWINLTIVGHFQLTTCRVLLYFLAYFSLCSSWLITAMSVEKYLAVRFPFKFRYLRNKKMLFRAIGAVYFFSLGSATPIIFTAYVGDGSIAHCNTFVEATALNMAYNGTLIAFQFAIPIILLTAFNFLIIQAVQQSRTEAMGFGLGAKCESRIAISASSSVALSSSELQISNAEMKVYNHGSIQLKGNLSETAHTGQTRGKKPDIDLQEDKIPTKTSSTVAKEHQMMRMLFAVSLIYLIFYLPFYARTIFFIAYGIHNNRVAAIFKICSVITRTLLFCNYAVNFYLYILVSKKFRTAFWKLFNRQPR